MSERLTDNWHNFQEKVAGLFRRMPDCTVFIDQTLSGDRSRKVKVDVLVGLIHKERDISMLVVAALYLRL